jgi:glycosyltransferase involved in cell wall biosynthesis
MPKVSVIIPTYNTVSYLAEAVESVLKQSFRDFEIVIVDDGSTDGTLDVAKQFEPQVKVLSKTNGGPASARNLAIKNSTGDYLAFLDSDDLWEEDKLAVQVAYLENNPQISLVYGEALMFGQTGNERKILRKIGYTQEPTFKKLLFGDFIPNSTVVVRRACFDEVGAFNEDCDLIGAEDFEYWLRVAHSHKLAGLARPLAFYRIREGNLMGDGKDIEKGLRLTLLTLRNIEARFPDVWRVNQVNQELLFARFHIRAGFAWKEQGRWANCLGQYYTALCHCPKPRVLRWIVAATLLKQWS